MREVRRVPAAFLLWSLALLACSRPPPIVWPPASPVTLAIVTWNMHAGRGDLPRLVSDVASGQLTGMAPRDVIFLLQEALEGGDHDVEALALGRRLFAFFSAVRSNGRRTSGNAILSSLPLAGPHAVALPQERQPRAAIAATVEVAEEKLFVVCAHLENRVNWWRGFLPSDTARGRQARALLRLAPPDMHGVLGGDMNTWLGPNEPAWRLLLARFPDTPPVPAQPTFRDRLVLDHLFFDLPDGWHAVRRVLPDAYGSDHHPVLAVISLP